MANLASSDVSYFEILGRVGHTVVSARWHHGHLTADPELWARGELLIKLGESFVAEGIALKVHAGLDEPFAAALTLIRCFDSITKAKIELAVDGHDESAQLAIEIMQAQPADHFEAWGTDGKFPQ